MPELRDSLPARSPPLHTTHGGQELESAAKTVPLHLPLPRLPLSLTAGLTGICCDKLAGIPSVTLAELSFQVSAVQFPAVCGRDGECSVT